MNHSSISGDLTFKPYNTKANLPLCTSLKIRLPGYCAETWLNNLPELTKTGFAVFKVFSAPPFLSYLVNVHLLEGGLQDLEILNVLVLQIGLQLHLPHHYGAWNIYVGINGTVSNAYRVT